MKFRNFLALVSLTILGLGFISCTSSQDRTFKRVNVDQFYRESGVVRYFIPNLPRWANVSPEYGCQRGVSITYLHLTNVMESFSLNYMQGLQLQLQYNMEKSNAYRFKDSALTVKEEEKLFFKSLDIIKAKNYPFKIPKFNRINVVNVDDYLGGKEKALKNLMDSAVMFEGRPVLISQCHRREELIDILTKARVNISGARIFSYELFSPFVSSGGNTGLDSVDLSKLFNKNQKIYFYYRKRVPKNIQGKFIKIKL